MPMEKKKHLPILITLIKYFMNRKILRNGKMKTQFLLKIIELTG